MPLLSSLTYFFFLGFPHQCSRALWSHADSVIYQVFQVVVTYFGSQTDWPGTRPKICFSNKFPGDGTGPETLLCEPLCKNKQSRLATTNSYMAVWVKDRLQDKGSLVIITIVGRCSSLRTEPESSSQILSSCPNIPNKSFVIHFYFPSWVIQTL